MTGIQFWEIQDGSGHYLQFSLQGISLEQFKTLSENFACTLSAHPHVSQLLKYAILCNQRWYTLSCQTHITGCTVQRRGANSYWSSQ